MKDGDHLSVMSFPNGNARSTVRTRSPLPDAPDQLEMLRAVTNLDEAVPIYRIGHGHRVLWLSRPVMAYCINECGYWSVVGSGVRIFSRRDTLEDALDDFYSCFLEMKADFYDVIQPGYEEVHRCYRGLIEGYRWPSIPNATDLSVSDSTAVERPMDLEAIRDRISPELYESLAKCSKENVWTDLFL